MYQLEVPPKLLSKALEDVVGDCVSVVGVDLNSCSVSHRCACSRSVCSPAICVTAMDVWWTICWGSPLHTPSQSVGAHRCTHHHNLLGLTAAHTITSGVIGSSSNPIASSHNCTVGSWYTRLIQQYRHYFQRGAIYGYIWGDAHSPGSIVAEGAWVYSAACSRSGGIP